MNDTKNKPMRSFVVWRCFDCRVMGMPILDAKVTVEVAVACKERRKK